jgi:hypothetical protein
MVSWLPWNGILDILILTADPSNFKAVDLDEVLERRRNKDLDFKPVLAAPSDLDFQPTNAIRFYKCSAERPKSSSACPAAGLRHSILHGFGAVHLPRAMALAKEFAAAALLDDRFQQQLVNFYLSRQPFGLRLLRDAAPSPRCAAGGATGATLSYTFIGAIGPELLIEHIVVEFPMDYVNAETIATLLFGRGARTPTRSVIRVSATNPKRKQPSPAEVTKTVSIAHWGEMAGYVDDVWTLCFYGYDRKKSARTSTDKEKDTASITVYGKRWTAEQK